MTVIVKDIFFTVAKFVIGGVKREFHTNPCQTSAIVCTAGLTGIAVLGKLFIAIGSICTSRSSQLDANKRFSVRTWAVTLVGSEKLAGIHAQIAIEGKEWYGASYRKFADFCADCCGCCGGESNVRLIDLKNRVFEYSRKSEVWLVSSSKVKRMLKVIEQEEHGLI